MSRSLLVLLAVIALLAGALWYASSTRVPSVDNAQGEIVVPVATVEVPATELVGTEPRARREEPADEVGRVPRGSHDTRESASMALGEELSSAHWVEGRVVFPPGTPSDEDAWVVARGRNFSDGSDHRARVEPDGSFRVAFSERTRSGWLALEGRYLDLPETVRWKRGDEDAVVMEPSLGGRLVVTVVPPPGSSRPLDGALSLSGYGGDRETKTLEGVSTVEWGGVPAATYSVTYRGDSFAAEVVSAVVKAGATSSVELHLRSGVSLAGVVLDEEGAGVARAHVGWMRVEGPGDHGFKLHPQTTKTDSLGRFRLGAFLAGETRVDARSDGFLPGSLSLGLLADGTVHDDLTIVLSRGLSVSGTVTWPDGSPAEASILLTPTLDGPESSSPEAMIARLENGRAAQGESGTDGRFTITGLADLPYALLASASTKDVTSYADPETGRERRRILRTAWKAELDHVAAGSGGLRLVLSTGILLTGRVVDDLGKPVDRFTVEARSVEAAHGAHGRASKTFRAAEGIFTMEGFSEGGWLVEATARGHAGSKAVSVTLPSKVPVELIIEREARVRGIVIGADGEPVTGVTVRAYQKPPVDSTMRSLHAQTNDHGEFDLGGLRSGMAKLMTDASEDYAPCVPYEIDLSVAQQIDDVVLRMRAGGILQGEIVNYRDGMRVTVIGLGGMGNSYYEEVVPDEHGRFVARGLPPGDFLARVEGFGLAERFTLGAAGVATVRISSPAEFTIVRGVLRANGRSLCEAQVSVQGARDGVSSFSVSHAWSNSNGAYELVVPRGVHRIRIEPEDYSWSWSGTLDASAVAEHVYNVSITLARVSGRLVDADGAPLTDRFVGALGDHPSDLVPVDERGGFELVLPLGKYQLLVSPSARLQLELGELLVERDLHLGDVVVRTTR